MSDQGYTDMRDGCYVCGGNPRARLVVRGKWLVCEKCGGSYGEATAADIAHLAAAPVVLKPNEKAPSCSSCNAPGLLYECVHCGANNYPPAPAAEAPHNAAAIERFAKEVVQLADASGHVLTIEQRPLLPLAMRNYETVVSVRAKR